jgi:hypothetical protein
VISKAQSNYDWLFIKPNLAVILHLLLDDLLSPLIIKSLLVLNAFLLKVSLDPDSSRGGLDSFVKVRLSFKLSLPILWSYLLHDVLHRWRSPVGQFRLLRAKLFLFATFTPELN